MKKYLLISIIVLLSSFALWFFLRSGSEAPTITTLDGSPFGSGDGVNIPGLGDDTVGENTSFDEEQVDAETKLFRISNTPTAGFVSFIRGSSTIVRYVDRGTGHISEALMPRAGSAGDLSRRKITNNTLPKVYEVIFRADGGAVLMRSLEGNSDVVKNLSLTLTAPKSTSSDALYSVTATNIRGGLKSVTAGIGNTLYYVLESGSSIVSSTFTADNPRTLFSSAFDDWRLGRTGNNVLAYTRASVLVQGYAYSLPAGGGSLSKLLGPLDGLTTIANTAGTKLLYSYVNGGVTRLAVKTVSSGDSYEILPATLAEKCAWSSKEADTFYCGTPINGVPVNEPDNWYLGRNHFVDYIWKFNTETEVAELVSQPKTDFNIDMDVYEPRVSPNDDFLVFLNKYDLTLWALKLK